MSLRLYKREKLCSVTAIENLFARKEGNGSAMLFCLDLAMA